MDRLLLWLLNYYGLSAGMILMYSGTLMPHHRLSTRQ